MPSYDLYGEAQARPSLDPVHLETLFTRSQLHDWKIRPHRHRHLHQVFWLPAGGGALQGEGGARRFEAPVLIAVPLGAVHGFHFRPQSSGMVLTVTEGFLAACGRLARDPWRPAAVLDIGLHRDAALRQAVAEAFAGLEAGFRGSGPGRGAAVAGQVLLVLSLLQRGADAEAAQQRPPSPQAALLARFRALLEAQLAERPGQPLPDLPAQCAALGVTTSTLTRACRAIAGSSPLQVVQALLLREAQRLLAYSTLNVAQVAYALGFEPAYFSRFFLRHAGITPAAFRRAAVERPG